MSRSQLAFLNNAFDILMFY
uniref:Uncharacterized protein n=1 Tax=Anguilla anguilla TaxID=7936 RepID=A0A0E9VLT2_ANGAN